MAAVGLPVTRSHDAKWLFFYRKRKGALLQVRLF
jgi:hypothetical protein